MSDIVFVMVTRIPGFEEEYGISEDGEVYSYRLKRFLKTTLDKGYYRVMLTKDERRYLKLLHRLIAETFIPNPDNLPLIDHINRDKTNNSIANLRWVTNQQNCMNQSKSKNTTSSLHKGVYWDKQHKKWRSQIMIDGKTINLGRFNSEEEAARKYDQKALELFGEFSVLNNI